MKTFLFKFEKKLKALNYIKVTSVFFYILIKEIKRLCFSRVMLLQKQNEVYKTILRKSWIALNRVRKTHTIISVIESGKVSSNENITQNP